MATRLMDGPPVLYEKNKFGRGTSSPEDVIRDQELMEARRELMEARRILHELGLAGVILDDLGYLTRGFDHLRLPRIDATEGLWDVVD